MKRKIIAISILAALAASSFAGCGKADEEDILQTSINVITNETMNSEGTDAPSDEELGNLEGGIESIPVDENGNAITEVPGGAPVGVITGSFYDPGADIDFGTTVSPDNNRVEVPIIATSVPKEERDKWTESYVATEPANQQEIIDMIMNGEITTTSAKKSNLTSYPVSSSSRYGYNQLSSDEKKLYDKILEAAKSCNSSIEVDDSISDETWLKVYGTMYIQEPELFWLTSVRVRTGKLWYWMTDPSEIAAAQKELDAAADAILSKASGKSTFEQLKIFHDSIVLGCEFGTDDGSLTKLHTQNVYGALVKHEVQCEGYAKAMQYLCDLSGIESMVVIGTSESGTSHAWNVVKVDGKWYNLDTTWDDPLLSYSDPTHVRYRYFLCPDSWLHNKSHFSINTKAYGTKIKYFDPPACTSDDMNYFTVNKLVFSDKASADAAIKDALKKASDSKTRAAEIRVSSKELYDQIAATDNLKSYASWIKGQNSNIKSVAQNCDPNTLVIELDIIYN